MDYEEMPSYSGMQLFSDIGGAACLGMGVSMASIVGIFEFIIYKYEILTLVCLHLSPEFRLIRGGMIHSKRLWYIFMDNRKRKKMDDIMTFDYVI